MRWLGGITDSVEMCCVLCLVTQLCPTLSKPMGLQTARLLWPQNSLGKNTAVFCHAPPPRDLPNPGIEPRSPTLQVDFLLTEPPGKPQWT